MNSPVIPPAGPKVVLKQLNVQVTPEMMATLERIGESTGRRRNEVVLLLLADGIQRQLAAMPVTP